MFYVVAQLAGHFILYERSCVIVYIRAELGFWLSITKSKPGSSIKQAK